MRPKQVKQSKESLTQTNAPLISSIVRDPIPTDPNEWTFHERLFMMTAQSPLIVAGIVSAREKLTGKSDKGDWEMYRITVQGCDGRTTSVTINDPKTCAQKGEFTAISVFVGNNGQLRECKRFGVDF
jgi:hypothetical protein